MKRYKKKKVKKYKFASFNINLCSEIPPRRRDFNGIAAVDPEGITNFRQIHAALKAVYPSHCCLKAADQEAADFWLTVATEPTAIFTGRFEDDK